MTKATRHRGFGPPQFWLQSIRGEDATTKGYNGNEQAIQVRAIALLKNADIVLVLSGDADPSDPKAADILAEYRKDNTGKGDQVLLQWAS